jgi:predicted permease
LGAQSIDPGFRIQDGLVASIDLATAGYSQEEGLRYYDRLLEQAEASPQVLSASLAQLTPLGLLNNIRSPAAVKGGAPVEIYLNRVGSGYFETLGIPLLRGRGFSPQDGPGASLVAVVNQTLSERFWPGQDPLGKVIVLSGRQSYEVVGVVRDSKYERLGEAPRPMLFQSWRQHYSPRLNLHLRVGAQPSALIPSVQEMIRGLDKGVILEVVTLEESIGLVFLLPRILAGIFALFGLTGLALSLVGVAGLVAFEVSRRSREIGIRMALGGTPGEILRMVTAQGMHSALLGILFGALASAGLSQLLSGFLYGVSPSDPWTFGGAALLLALATLLACAFPARRAVRTDAVKALRCS